MMTAAIGVSMVVVEAAVRVSVVATMPRMTLLTHSAMNPTIDAAGLVLVMMVVVVSGAAVVVTRRTA